MHDVVVIGGGIAGLTAAFDLSRAGLDVVTLEAAARPGGNIGTLEHEDEGRYRLETGPHSFMGSAESVFRLVEEMGLEDEVVPAAEAAARRYIYRDGRLMALPTSVGAFLGSGVLSFGGKLRLAVEPLIRSGAQPSETAWTFFSRRFGEEAATYIMSPFISGVYAGDIHALGARAAFPKFWDFERDSGSMIRGAMRYMRQKRRRLKLAGRPARKGLFSMPGGLGELTDQVARRLGAALRLEQRVRSIRDDEGGVLVETEEGPIRGRAAILAVPPHRAAAIVEGVAPAAAEELRAIPMVPVALVHWTTSGGDGGFAPPSGFGFLVPRVTGLRLLGTLFPSQIFEGRAPAGQSLYASYYGGATDGDAATMGDDELWELLLEEHRGVFGDQLESARLLRVLRHEAAIPQLLPEHPERVEAVRRHLEGVPGLSLAGNYLTGVGIEAAVESGYHAAGEARRYIDPVEAEREVA